MGEPGSGEMVVFGEFRLGLHGAGLFRCVDGDRLLPIGIGSRALTLLGVLVEHASEVVSKDAIMAAVWPGIVVEEANLSVQLSKLRRVLDAGLPEGSHIETVPRLGYRFTRPVTRCPMPIRTNEPFRIGEAAAPVRVTPAAVHSKRCSTAAYIISGASILAIILMGAFTWQLHPPNASRPAAYSAQDRRRSVMVLPFENSSGDPAQSALAAGITRELTDTIAMDDGVPIVSRAGSTVYQGPSINLRAIGREYDVHFVLSGHAHRQDGRIIVVATVAQTYDERTVWVQHYDVPDRSDGLQSIIQSIGDGFDDATQKAEWVRAKIEHPNDLDKRDLLFGANATSSWQPSAENYLMRIARVERALALDPNFLWALRKTAMLHAQLVLDGFSADRDADLSIATKATDRAMMLAPDDISVLRTKATVLRARKDWKGADALFRKNIELQPMFAGNYIEFAQVLMEEGSYQRALELLTTAQNLVVPSEYGKYLHLRMATALVANERYAEAIGPARLAILEFPPESSAYGEPAWLALIAAETENGHDAEGQADLRAFLATPRSFRDIGTIQKVDYLALNQNLLDGLRRAGMQSN